MFLSLAVVAAPDVENEVKGIQARSVDTDAEERMPSC